MKLSRKQIWIICSCVILIIILIIWGLFYYSQKQKELAIVEKQLQDSWESIEIDDPEIDAESVQERISILKKRLSLKWLIQDGDIHFQNEEYTRALAKYLQALRQNPKDESIINKIGNINFKLHKYDQAYKYYSQIIGYSQLDTHRALRSLFYSVDLSGNKTIFVLEEMNKFELSEAEKFYYKTAIECSKNFVGCKNTFIDYFWENPQWSIPWVWTWSTIISDNIIVFEELENIRQALKNYENFKLNDLSYQAALISGAFYQNRLYPVAISTAQSTLKISPDYRPLIKIIARSNYEIGNYTEAKKFLIQYNNLWDNEPEVSYFLWIVHQKLREYTRSIIQLRKAESLWFENTIDIKRRLIFNYYKLWDHEKMLKIFWELMTQDAGDITIDDVNLAVFYNILYEKYSQATVFTKKWLELFPESELFYWYSAWLMIQQDEISEEKMTEIENFLKKWLEINDKSPMINVTFWQLEEKKNNKQKAFIYYKKTISLDPGGEYSKLAEEKIQALNLEE